MRTDLLAEQIGALDLVCKIRRSSNEDALQPHRGPKSRTARGLERRFWRLPSASAI